MYHTIDMLGHDTGHFCEHYKKTIALGNLRMRNPARDRTAHAGHIRWIEYSSNIEARQGLLDISPPMPNHGNDRRRVSGQQYSRGPPYQWYTIELGQ